MSSNRRQRRKARARMKQNGEPYTEALRAVRALDDRRRRNANTSRQITRYRPLTEQEAAAGGPGFLIARGVNRRDLLRAVRSLG